MFRLGGNDANSTDDGLQENANNGGFSEAGMLERVKCGWEVFQLINTWWSDRSQVSQAGERWLAPLSRELHLRLIPNNLPKDKFKFKTYLETGSSRCAGHALQRRRPHFTICHLALFPAPWAIICNPSPWRSINSSKNQSSSTKTSTCDSLSLSLSRALHKETFHGSQVYLGLNL